MPRSEFERFDTVLSIDNGAKGEVVITRMGSHPRQERIRVGPLPERLREELCVPENVKGTGTAGAVPIRRLALHIRELPVHAYPWEDWVPPRESQTQFDAVVRISEVPARVAQITFTPPLRVLLADSSEPTQMLESIRALYGRNQPDARVAKAYRGGAIPLQEVKDTGTVPLGWPVVDVLHLCRFPIAAPGVDTFSPDADERGSLGWLVRLLHAWQTRVLVIDVGTPSHAETARRLAAAVCARAGPGVIIRFAVEPLEHLYDRQVHDMPLDAFGGEKFRWSPRPLPRLDSLFVGGGREELARASAPLLALDTLQRRLHAATISSRPPSAGGTPRAPRLPALVRDLSRSKEAAPAISNLVEQHRNWTFNLHESDGVLPMSESFDALRGATERLVRASRARARRIKPRYVNGSLWHGEPGSDRVDALIERLVVGRPYQLALDIGARDRLIPVYETSPFKEIPRTAKDRGVWLEIAVNGVGFAVEGDPVQDLWLPFDEPSDEVRFAVTPLREGVAVLRYTIYYRQNVVQTYRLAALTCKDTGEEDAEFDAFDAPEARRLLARALGGSVRRIPLDATYVTRLEYEGASIANAAALPERRVSIVANEIDDVRVITVKGRKFFFDSKPGAPNELVDTARDKLFEISVNKIGPAREDWIANFGSNRANNEQKLKALLPDLALAGFSMYDNVFAKESRDELEKDLAGAGSKITVAHTLLEDVVPWALMYDREYTNKAVSGGHLAVCTAALPGATGELSVTECGKSPNCVLHRPGVAAANVACPLHFWGFRHEIELPPKQARGVREAQASGVASTQPAPTAGGVRVAPRLTAVFNAALVSANEHEKQLRALHLPGGAPVVWEEIEMHPNRLIEALDDTDLDLVYLYCHARGGVGDPAKTKPPMLEFSDKSGTFQYRAADVQVVWRRRPLVIVNGCSTAAFSPDALSPFVQKFTRDCKAGGMVGTEIPVHETLATRFMTRLLERVIDGEAVGAALLAVRRELLAESNPLGLAYTVFAFSELKIGA